MFACWSFNSQKEEASLNRSHLSPGFCKELNLAKMSMISNHSDEYISDDDLNSGDNSIVDPNDDVLQDGSDGKKGNLTKGPWGTKEDKRLISYVTNNGPLKWRAVARQLNRTPKSCRNRWCNQLNPDIIHAPFTAEEDKLIASMADDRGWGKWSRIAKKLKGRTDNQVKNRWYSKLAKQYGELRVKSPSRNLTQTARTISASLPTSASTSPARHLIALRVLVCVHLAMRQMMFCTLAYSLTPLECILRHLSNKRQ